MDANERDIVNFLQTWGSEFVSVKEICRRAGTKKRYNEEPDWAKPVLQMMVEHGLLERDSMGRYRLKPKSKKSHSARWMSPEIAKLMNENSVVIDAETADTNLGESEST